MTKIDIFSGFLGAGKTTLIKKLINEAYKGAAGGGSDYSGPAYWRQPFKHSR